MLQLCGWHLYNDTTATNNEREVVVLGTLNETSLGQQYALVDASLHLYAFSFIHSAPSSFLLYFA